MKATFTKLCPDATKGAWKESMSWETRMYGNPRHCDLIREFIRTTRAPRVSPGRHRVCYRHYRRRQNKQTFILWEFWPFWVCAPSGLLTLAPTLKPPSLSSTDVPTHESRSFFVICINDDVTTWSISASSTLATQTKDVDNRRWRLVRQIVWR